ncbi:pectinesterase [Andrographis paniculata]|uniref:pectinesterase n=1 Tax=Andrographis paniculata TaxID=175694 RepID=UPI0021E8CA0E|nr:pectinesterase [Andrographis paniculata]
MSRLCFTVFLLLLAAATAAVHCNNELQAVAMAREALLLQSGRVGYEMLSGSGGDDGADALADCVKLYEAAEPRLGLLVFAGDSNFSRDDAVTWLGAALASHATCLDGLGEREWLVEAGQARNLTRLISRALALYSAAGGADTRRKSSTGSDVAGLLASWDVTTSKADLVVAQDGSGNYRTVSEAVAALGRKRPAGGRIVVHVKSGVYRETVDIGRNLKNVMFVGDGIDRTVITAGRNVPDGATTFNSATFGVSGDGFWARDMTFENTAGPEKHQAVAARVSSDESVFYRCSFRGYQDTLFVHSLRQFYRDCHVYGTIDFIFGDAATVFQNCDILVRRPMDHQSNIITAQGRSDPNQNTGISIVNSRVSPAGNFQAVKGKFKTYLGRPWKPYSRTVIMKTELDGFVDGKGWKEWSGDYGLKTLYYAEYMNSGAGASTASRVKWPGFHLMHDRREAEGFSAGKFISGESWIPATGVPFMAGI